MTLRVNIENVQTLRTEEEFIASAVELLQQGSKYVRIRSAMLDPALFDTREFNEALSAFARKSRYCEVHILIDFPDLLLRRGHRTLELMRRLTEKITIKSYFDEPDEHRESYILTDNRGVLIKYPSQDEEGYYSNEDSIYTSSLVETFKYEWQRSPLARQLRTMII